MRHLNLGDNNSRDHDDVCIGITGESAEMLAKLLELGRFPALAHLLLTNTDIKGQGRTRLREAWGLKGAQGYDRPARGRTACCLILWTSTTSMGRARPKNAVNTFNTWHTVHRMLMRPVRR